jgi:WD repeat-containing protein 22
MANFLDVLKTRQERGLSYQTVVEFQYEANQKTRSEFYSKDLKAHFGCVNALAFSKNGKFLASGGDDRRILIWDMAKTLSDAKKPNKHMIGCHESNVFCIDFDIKLEKIISGGNDEKVLVHDLETGKTKDIFPHDEPVYGIACHPECSELFASASSDGRVLVFDLRESNNDPVMLHGSGFAFHDVSFNPVDPRLVLTANQNEGVSLLDYRKLNKPIMKYGISQQNQQKSSKISAMSAKFSQNGSQIFALGRRMNPVLYDISSPKALVEFDHPGYFNSCTMKSGTFGSQDLVYSGSDDFNIYAWKIPIHSETNQPTKIIKRADFVLKGHRSIVNQVRFNPVFNCVASSGVEKKIKLWSPFDITNDDVDKRGPSFSRRIHRREDHGWMVQNSSNLLDCEHESVEENPKMLAFFDSLVQRDLSSDETETDNDRASPEFEEEIASSHSDTSDSTTTDDIDTVIAKKREVINIKKSKRAKNRQIRGSRTGNGSGSTTGNGRLSSQDSSEYVKQTIESAREALISTSSSDSSETESVNTEQLLDQTTLPKLSNNTQCSINPPPPNSEVDKNMQNEILQALKTEIQQNNADSTDSESDTEQTTSRQIVFKKSKKGTGRCYRTQN